MILFWVELLRSILLFMFVLGHFLSLGSLTHFGSKVFPFFVLWESLATRSPFGTCQRLSAIGPFFPRSVLGPFFSLGHLSCWDLRCFPFLFLGIP